jgi:hypothetical protein
MTSTSAAAARNDVGDLYQQRLMRIVFGAVLTSTAAAALILGLRGISARLVLIVGVGVAVLAVLLVRVLPRPRHLHGKRLSLWLPVVGIGLTAPLIYASLWFILWTDANLFNAWCFRLCAGAAPTCVAFIVLATRSVLTSLQLEKSPMSTPGIWFWTTLSAFTSFVGFELCGIDDWIFLRACRCSTSAWCCPAPNNQRRSPLATSLHRFARPRKWWARALMVPTRASSKRVATTIWLVKNNRSTPSLSSTSPLSLRWLA